MASAGKTKITIADNNKMHTVLQCGPPESLPLPYRYTHPAFCFCLFMKQIKKKPTIKQNKTKKKKDEMSVGMFVVAKRRKPSVLLAGRGASIHSECDQRKGWEKKRTLPAVYANPRCY